MTDDNSYWYLASYPKSGNTWCRVFITELMRLAGDDSGHELNLNQDIETGAIAKNSNGEMFELKKHQFIPIAFLTFLIIYLGVETSLTVGVSQSIAYDIIYGVN